MSNNIDNEIMAFLNISFDCLMKQDEGLIEKLRDAAQKDEFDKVHNLGYDLKDRK